MRLGQGFSLAVKAGKLLFQTGKSDTIVRRVSRKTVTVLPLPPHYRLPPGPVDLQGFPSPPCLLAQDGAFVPR